MPSSLLPAEHAVLGLLMLKPMHGYEIARYFSGGYGLAQVCHLTQSLLYALLKRMEGRGLVEASTQVQGARPPRRVYSLTPLGREEVLRWLNQPVGRIREIRLDFLLKLYFSRRLPGHSTRALVDRQIEVCHSYLAELESQLAARPEDDFDHLVLRSRISAARGTIEWLGSYRESLA